MNHENHTLVARRGRVPRVAVVGTTVTFGIKLPTVGEIWRRKIWQNQPEPYMEREVTGVLTAGPLVTIVYASLPSRTAARCSLGQWLHWTQHAQKVQP